MNSVVSKSGAFPGCESSIGKTERLYAELERQVLNPCGYIPFVSSISGPLRALIGVIQTVAYSALSFVAFTDGARALSERFDCTMKNGLANIFRGCIETVPIAGNLLCYTYDSNGVSMQYLGERTDLEAFGYRFMSNLEIVRSRIPQLSCF